MNKSQKITASVLFLIIFGATNLYSEQNSSNSDEKKNTISYNAGSTLLWGVGATAVPLTYIFVPITYTRKINNSWSFAQFLMYRFEHYENPSNTWHNFHELFALPGVRYSFSGEYEKGLFLSAHLGAGFGLGPNLKFASLNAYSEIGYIFPNIYKDLYISLNVGLLYSYILSSSAPDHPAYSWSKSNFIAKLSHILTPLGVASIGWKF